MAKQELEQARAARDRTQHLIGRAVIRAPFPGHVVERMRQLGAFVSAGTEVVRLTDTTNVEVVARAPVAEAGQLAVGQAVSVHGNAEQAEIKIRAIVPVGDERSHLLEVRVGLTGTGWTIGSAVRVDLPAAQVAASLVVGDLSVVRGGERLRAGQAVTIMTSSASASTKPAPPAG